MNNVDLEKMEPIYEQIKKLSPSEICWLIRNITYHLVSYYNEEDKGIIYNGSYDRGLIEQATRLQQKIREDADIFNQILDHRIFEDDYFEDILSNHYYGKYISAKKEAEEYKEKAWKYDELCDEED